MDGGWRQGSSHYLLAHSVTIVKLQSKTNIKSTKQKLTSDSKTPSALGKAVCMSQVYVVTVTSVRVYWWGTCPLWSRQPLDVLVVIYTLFRYTVDNFATVFRFGLLSNYLLWPWRPFSEKTLMLRENWLPTLVTLLCCLLFCVVLSWSL